MPAGRLDDVRLSYPGRPPRRALDGLSLDIEAGEVTGLLGPNGAGKSSAIAVLTGLRKASGGRATVLGGTPGRLAARERVHVMLQEDGLPSGARGPELVRHVARLRGAPETADAVIERLGVAALGRTTVRRLSGGERRRVSLACALVGHPDLVVLDEPTAGLDPRGRVIVWETIRALRDSGTTVLLSTHLLDEAESLSDRIAIVAHGRCVAQGTLAQLTSAGSDVLSFEAPVHLDTLSLATALPEGCDAEEVSPGRYRVRGPIDPHVLATVTSWCAQHGVMPRNLRTGGTSLEDLFWDLTAGAEETS